MGKNPFPRRVVRGSHIADVKIATGLASCALCNGNYTGTPLWLHRLPSAPGPCGMALLRKRGFHIRPRVTISHPRTLHGFPESIVKSKAYRRACLSRSHPFEYRSHCNILLEVPKRYLATQDLMTPLYRCVTFCYRCPRKTGRLGV